MRVQPWMVVGLTLAAGGCGNSRIRTFYVDHHKAECHGEAIGLCFLVRDAPGDDPLLMYGAIHGFDFEWGNTYEITVREIDLEEPIPVDALSIRRELERVDQSTRVAAGTTFTMALTTAHGFVVETEPGRFRFHSEHDFVCGPDLPCDELRTLIAEGATVTFTFAHSEAAADPLIVMSWQRV